MQVESATDAEKLAIVHARRDADDRMRSNLVRWIETAMRMHAEDPSTFTATTMTGDQWSVFVNTIGISKAGRTVMTVPNIHGWPFTGPMDPTMRNLTDAEIASVLASVASLPRELVGEDEESVLAAVASLPGDGGGASLKKDVEEASMLFGACLRTMDRDLHDMMRTDEDRCWMLVSLEQEDGLATCVLDGSDAEDADEARAWHPPATAADAVTARMSCSRAERTWRIDGVDWKRKVECVLPIPTDSMETLRLCAPHLRL